MTKTVLVGVDRSDASRRAVAFSAERAAQLGYSLCLAHVIPWSRYSFTTPSENAVRHATKQAEIKAATAQVIDPSLAIVAETGQDADVVVVHGDPVDTLIEISADRDVLQIVVGRTGDGPIRQRVFGSIPGHLVQVAKTPVTVVP